MTLSYYSYYSKSRPPPPTTTSPRAWPWPKGSSRCCCWTAAACDSTTAVAEVSWASRFRREPAPWYQTAVASSLAATLTIWSFPFCLCLACLACCLVRKTRLARWLVLARLSIDPIVVMVDRDARWRCRDELQPGNRRCRRSARAHHAGQVFNAKPK